MAFQKVCVLDDLWEGDMASFEVNGQEILLIWPENGELKAFQGACPHQGIPLVEGEFDGKTLTCRAHEWLFDGCTGSGINPDNCRLAVYPVKIEDEQVFVDTDGIVPFHAHT